MRHPGMTVSPEFVGLLHSLYRKQYGGSPQKLKTELPLSSFIGERLSPARLPPIQTLQVQVTTCSSDQLAIKISGSCDPPPSS